MSIYCVMYADAGCYSGTGDPADILHRVLPSHSIREFLNYIALISEMLWHDLDSNLDVVYI